MKVIFKLFWLSLRCEKAYADGEETTFEKMGEDGWEIISIGFDGNSINKYGEHICLAKKVIDNY